MNDAQVWSDPTTGVVLRFYMFLMSVMYFTFAGAYVEVVRNRDTFVPFFRRYIGFLQNGKTNLETKRKIEK